MDLPQQPQQQPVASAVDQLKQQNQQAHDQFQAQSDASTQYFLQNQQNQSGPVSQALAVLGDKSKAGQIGKAIQTPAYAGYCLQYVDDKTGNSNRQKTAIDDFKVNAQQGNINQSESAPKGARVYFNADQTNDNMGHVGLSNGDGTFTSATDNGIKTFSLKDWQKLTGQQFLGWAK